MEVDQARNDEPPGSVDLFATLCLLGRPDLRDHAIFDNDIARTGSGCTIAFNDQCITDDQALGLNPMLGFRTQEHRRWK